MTDPDHVSDHVGRGYGTLLYRRQFPGPLLHTFTAFQLLHTTSTITLLERMRGWNSPARSWISGHSGLRMHVAHVHYDPQCHRPPSPKVLSPSNAFGPSLLLLLLLYNTIHCHAPTAVDVESSAHSRGERSVFKRPPSKPRPT